jgi:hypothetical protein
MHSEALSETFNPTQTGGIVVDADRIFLPFTVYSRTDFQEVAARPADIRLLGGTLWTNAARRTNKADSNQGKNRE